MDKFAALLYVAGIVSEDMTVDQICTEADLVRECLIKLVHDLDTLDDEASEAEIQSIYYEAGKLHFGSRLRWWFQILYQVLLKQSDGPRLGQLTKIMTVYWVQQKIQAALNDFWQTHVSMPVFVTTKETD